MIRVKGYSLIELVIVIVIIGLLAMTALPKFLNITEEAKLSALKSMSGGFATAVMSARAQWEAVGRPVDRHNNNSINYDGSLFRLTKAITNDTVLDGYPFAVSASNTVIVNQLTSEDCVDLMASLLQNAPKVTANLADIETDNMLFYATVSGLEVKKQCRYYQLASASRNSSGSINVTAGHSFTYIPALGRVEVNLKNKME